MYPAQHRAPAEERILYGLLIVIGLIPVVITHGVFGVDATIGLLMIGAGALGFAAIAWKNR